MFARVLGLLWLTTWPAAGDPALYLSMGPLQAVKTSGFATTAAFAGSCDGSAAVDRNNLPRYVVG